MACKGEGEEYAEWGGGGMGYAEWEGEGDKEGWD